MNFAKAKVYLSYDGELEQLATSVQESLGLPEFWFKSDQDAPYEVVAHCECLGFEIWLKQNGERHGYNFSLELEPSVDISDHGKVQSCDISLWFSKHLTNVGGHAASV